MANFPSSLDSFTTKVDAVDVVFAADVNNLQSAVVAIEKGGEVPQSIAYAASITPDCSLGTLVLVGTLTGNITINAPINTATGRKLHFIFTQDGTGGRTVTWNAAFTVTYWTVNTAANAVTEAVATYNGTKWFVAVNPAVSGSRPSGKGGLWFNILDYGGVGDAITDANCAMTSGQSVLSTTTTPGPFTAAMVGRKVSVANALFAGNPGGSGTGTVTGFTDSKHLTVSFSCTNTVAGVKALICTQDDTPALRAAEAAAEAAGGGTVYIPGGGWVIQPQSVADTDCLVIRASNVRILGAGREVTRLIFAVYPLLDPATNWQNNGGLVLRGDGIKIVSTSTSVPLSNVIFQDFTLDGWSGYTGNNTIPANIGTGDGWDTTNKGIWRVDTGGVLYDNIRLDNLHICHWRGECEYAGGAPANLGRIFIYDCELNDTNADGISDSGELYAYRNHIYKHAANGFDEAIWGRHEVVDNTIHDCDLDGINIYTGGSSAVGPLIIEQNRLANCKRTGIDANSPYNTTIRFNHLTDCGWTGQQSAINCAQTGAWGSSNAKGIHITDNHMYANAQNLQNGIALNAGATTMDDVEVDRNYVGVTTLGVAAGKTIVTPLTLAGTITNARIITPYAKGVTFEYTDQAYAYESLLTTTSATDVVKWRPVVNGMYRVSVYFRVITGATNVTVNVTYYDAAGSQITVNVLALTSEPVGSYRFAPMFIGAQGATESQYIKVTVTAGTANQVYVTAAIREDFK